FFSHFGIDQHQCRETANVAEDILARIVLTVSAHLRKLRLQPMIEIVDRCDERKERGKGMPLQALLAELQNQIDSSPPKCKRVLALAIERIWIDLLLRLQGRRHGVGF